MLVQRTVAWGFAGLGVANVLSVMGVDLSVLLGAAGFVTVAVGFAAQTSMSNFISGVFLMVESSVQVGDYIELDGISAKWWPSSHWVSGCAPSIIGWCGFPTRPW